MDIPKNIGDVTDLAKKAALENDTVANVVESVSDNLDKVESLADTLGLGDELDTIVNKVEDTIGLDIDGDGDTGA